MEPVYVSVASGTPFEVSARALRCGEDWCVSICGGTLRHVGGVALGLPQGEQPPALSAPGHKDYVVAERAARRLAAALGCRVAVSAGIHVDNASKEEVALLVENSAACCAALIKALEKDRGPGDNSRLG